MRAICEDIYVINMKFATKTDREPGKHSIPISLEPEYAESSDTDDKASRLILKVEVGEEESEELPFYFSMELAGIFTWNDLTEEEAEKQIMSEGTELLLSFARASLYDIMGKARLSQIILPVEHFEVEETE